MDFGYSDLLGLERPVHADDLFSRRHPKMAQLNRAKLFAPFAALAGFDSAVRAKEIRYVPRRIPDAEETEALDRALNLLYRATWCGELARRNRIPVRVEYFEVCADVNHEGFGRLGLYRVETGVVRRVDPVAQVLAVGDRVIPFADLAAVTAPDGAPLADA